MSKQACKLDASDMADKVAIRANELGQRILSCAHSDGLRSGDRLPELWLARKCDVSRTPIRRALAFLVERGLAANVKGAGYKLLVTPDETHLKALQDVLPHEVDLRQRILREYAQRRIGPVVMISELARRYDAPRGKVQSALKELAVLSVVEKSAGQSWIFRSDREAVTSARQSLEFRLALESAAIDAPTFELRPDMLHDVRQMALDVLAMPPHRIDPAFLAEAERYFHLYIAAISGNAFIESTLRSHLLLLENLMVPVGVNDHMARRAMEDHLQILENIEAGERTIARDRLRVHLSMMHGPREWIHTATALPRQTVTS